MPYIKKEDRTRARFVPEAPGELNFALTAMILRYLGDNPGYTRFNDVLGVLSAISMELNRRMIVPYEEKKIKENGDVYGTTKRT